MSKEKKDKKEKKGISKKLKHSTLSLILTIVVICAVVLVNVTATMLFERYPLAWDMTDKKIYTVSQTSKDYIKNIDTDVTVTIFSDESTYSGFNYPYNKQALELLKNYCRENSRISYRFVEIDKNPDIARGYTDVKNMDIVFETSKGSGSEKQSRTRKVGVSDIINFQDRLVEGLSSSGYTIESYAKNNLEGSQEAFVRYFSNYIESSNAEQAFTSALMAVTDPKPVYVTFLTGRNELADLSYMKTLLEANGYNISTVDLTKQDIPENTDAAVICAPQTDYMQAEIDKLEKYLSGKNKSIISFSHAAQKQTPLLDGLMKKYGLAAGEGTVCESDTDRYYNQPYFTLADDIAQYLSGEMQSDSPKLLVAQSRPVEMADTGNSQVSTTMLLGSSAGAYTADTAALVNGESKVLKSGKQCYAALGKDDESGNTAVLIGTSSIAEDQFMAYGQYSNRDFILALFARLTGKTEGVRIEPKVLEQTAFEITQGEKQVLKWTFIVILPLAVAGTGIFVTVRRKRR